MFLNVLGNIVMKSPKIMDKRFLFFREIKQCNLSIALRKLFFSSCGYIVNNCGNGDYYFTILTVFYCCLRGPSK